MILFLMRIVALLPREKTVLAVPFGEVAFLGHVAMGRLMAQRRTMCSRVSQTLGFPDAGGDFDVGQGVMRPVSPM